MKIKEKTNKKQARFVLSIVLGLIFTFIFFEIALFAIGKLENIIHNTKNNFSKNDEFVILALGDSTTAPAYDFKMRDYSWPVYLEQLLNEEDIEKNIKIINKGETTTTSNKILSNLEKNIEKYDPDLVISMMGINDFYDEEILYEAAANIESDSLLSKSRTYKLIKFLIANIREKRELKAKEKLDCYSEESCLNLAAQQNTNDYLETELDIKFLNKVLEYNPDNIQAIVELGHLYSSDYNLNNIDDLIKAIAMFEKALENEYRNPKTYLGLANSLIKLEDYYISPYIENKNSLIDQKGLNEKVKISMEKIKTDVKKHNIQDADLFLMLANYEACSEDSCCEIELTANENETKIFYFQKALEFGSNNPQVLFEIARYHAQCGNINEAEKLYLKILETPINSKNHVSSEVHITSLIELANIYLESNREELANDLFKKAIDVGGIYVQNYKKLYEILASKNIKLIAVQYPMRSTKPLDLIFDNSDVLIVDNKIAFKELVEKEGYEQVFIDKAAGDFGHCTQKGNLLLARNIKSVILENWEEISSEN